MEILLAIALGYLLITTAVLFRNRVDFKPLEPTPPAYFHERAPSVSICIPARNEAGTIERCVRSAAAQKYPHYQIYVVDDNSTDGTGAILEKLAKTFPGKLTVIPGKRKPEDWLGKPWACHQLSQAANGDILIFVDADTWMEAETTGRVVRTMGHDIIDFLTVWPKQHLQTFWEKTVIPIIYFALLTLLPAKYVYRPPRWIPRFLRKKTVPLFAAACGQFMAFKREIYQAVGGHVSVKKNVVEDVELARNVKRAGYSMNMYHGEKTVSCRMYHSGKELWEGIRKNFFAGFGRNLFLFCLLGGLHLITFLLPAAVLPFLLLTGEFRLLMLTLTVLSLMILQRWVVDRWFNWNPAYGFLHPLGVFWFQMMGVRVLLDNLMQESVHWKGRPV